MTARKAITKKTRFEVFKRDNFKCQYCGESAPNAILHIDHIQPVSKGGDNDITNLITSCFDCNMGKKDRLLDDKSVLLKQKAQLDELNEKRNQLEMMMKWRRELKSIESKTLNIAVNQWEDMVSPYSLNDSGKSTLTKLIKKFGLNVVLDSIEISKKYLIEVKDQPYDYDSVNLAFNKISGICNINTQPDYLRQIHYIKGICKNRYAYCNEYALVKKLKSAYEIGIDLDELKELAKDCRNWSEFNQALDELMEVLNGSR